MPVKIKSIDIKAFRGIPELNLKLDGKNLLVRGDNGTGKSSLIDAVEFFFRGKVSHLEGVQGLSLQKHATHIKSKTSDVKVDISFDPGNISLSRTFHDEPNSSDSLKQYFDIAATSKFILRRSQILEFIITQPAERYRAIENIIGIDKLEIYELNLMRTRDEFETDVSSCKNAKISILGQLSSLLNQEINTDNDIITGLNLYLKDSGMPALDSIDNIDKHTEFMLKQVKNEKDIEKFKAVEDILLSTKTGFLNTEKLIGNIQNVNNQIIGIKGREKTELDLANLLNAGNSVLDSWKTDYCPLCQQKIDRNELANIIRRRLSLVKELSNQSSSLRVAFGLLKSDLDDILNRTTLLATKLKTLPTLDTEREIINSRISSIKDLTQKINSSHEKEQEIDLKYCQEKFEHLLNSIAAIHTKCEVLSKTEKLTEVDKRLIKTAELIGEVRSKLKDLRNNEKSLNDASTHFTTANIIYSKFSEVKKNKVQGLFNVIEQDMNKYYLILHPDDDHKDIRLILSPGKRSSLELKIQSFGKKDEDPRAFSSEGHLDSLGLCIFLAFVKKFNSGCNLVILDDVVTTVDANHRSRICKLLHEEFIEYQVFITTHDEIWNSQLFNYHRAHGLEGNYKYINITGWNKEQGPKLEPYKIGWEKIEEKIAKGDKSVGNEGRIYLEWILDTICEMFEVPVPFRKKREYEIGILLPSAKKKLKDLIKDISYKDKINEAFVNVESTAFYGNLLSHNNEIGADLSIDEIKLFCECIHDLHNLLICPSCKKPLVFLRSISRVKCSNSICGNFEIVTN